MQRYAVINGDMIGSTRLNKARREFYLGQLKTLFDILKKEKAFGVIRSFQVYRGDSFQGALVKPEKSLQVMLMIRSYMRMLTARYGAKAKKSIAVNRSSFNTLTDLRLAVGIGSVSKLNIKLMESDGEAFHRSGKLIDSMKKSGVNMAIETPWPDKNEELEVFFGLLDAIISRWSPQQAEVVYHRLQGLNQTQIAEQLKTSVSAINQRLKTANWSSVGKLLVLFESRIKKQKG